MPVGRHVYRVLYEVRSGPSREPPADVNLALVSVAVAAENAAAAQDAARRMLIPQGWEPLGPPVRTTDLTSLMETTEGGMDDSTYGAYAEQWLRAIHEEAMREGASLQILAGDYGFMDQPAKILPRAGPRAGL